MSNPTIRRAWPLYLAIAASGAASIATSTTTPPLFAYRYFQGPALRLDPTSVTDAAPFTVLVSPGYGDTTIELMGVLTYDLDGSSEDLRIALGEPGQGVMAEQVHHLEGAGQLQFSLAKYMQVQCALASTQVCDQTLELRVDTAGALSGTLSGTIDVEWYLSAQLNSELEDAPPDLVFEVDVPDGTPMDVSPWLEMPYLPEEQYGDGRWRADAPLGLIFDEEAPGDRQRILMRGEGGFTSSRLSLYVTLDNLYILDLDEPDTVNLKLTVIPDEPGTAPVVERVVTFTGDNATQFEFSIPEPLDCPPGPVCERSFTVTLDAEGADAGNVVAVLTAYGIIEGDGEYAPEDAKVSVEPVEPN